MFTDDFFILFFCYRYIFEKRRRKAFLNAKKSDQGYIGQQLCQTKCFNKNAVTYSLYGYLNFKCIMLSKFCTILKIKFHLLNYETPRFFINCLLVLFSLTWLYRREWFSLYPSDIAAYHHLRSLSHWGSCAAFVYSEKLFSVWTADDK